MPFQAGALLDDKLKDEFIDEISEEYDEVREEHYDSLKVTLLYLSLDNFLYIFA